MRKLLAAALVITAVSSQAAWEKVGEVKVAGADGLVAAAAKIGQMCQVPTLGDSARKAIYGCDFVKYLGPTRDGEAVLMPVYMDAEKLFAREPDLDALSESFGIALIYPTVATKEKFLKHHADAVVTNGLIRVDFDESGDPDYVQFTPDGKWLVLSDKPEFVARAMKDVASAKSPLNGDVVRLTLNKRGVKAALQALQAVRQKCGSKLTVFQALSFDYYLGVLEGVSACDVSARVGDMGVDIRFSVDPVPGSELSKVGLKDLGKDPLGFADKSAVYGVAKAEDGGPAWNAPALYKAIEGVLKANDIDTGWIAFESKRSVANVTLDLTRATQWGLSCITNEASDLNVDKLCKDYEKAMIPFLKPFSAKGPREAAAVRIKGQRTTYSLAERYAATFPDLKEKPTYCAAAGSLLALFRMALPAVQAALPAEQQIMIVQISALIPKEEAGGIAAAIWRDGEKHVGLLRVSADEIRGCSSLVMAGMQMFGALSGDGATDAADDDDDADD